MELQFRKPTIFEAPDLEGNPVKYIILPMQVEYVPKLMEFLEINKEKKEIEDKNKKRRKKEETKNTLDPELEEKFGELMKFIIDNTTRSIETDEPLPDYHRNPSNIMKIINKVIELTNLGAKEEGGTPLKKNTPKKT